MPESVHDWLKFNNILFCLQVNETAKYLEDPDVRKRLGLGISTVAGGNGSGDGNAPFERVIQTDVVVNLETPQGLWYDNEFLPKLEIFNTAYKAWEDAGNRTPVKNIALQNARKELSALYRTLYQGIIKRNPLVTDMDLELMGFPRNGGARTPAAIPSSYPEAQAKSIAHGVLELHFHDSESGKKGKPKGVHGAEIAWGIFDVAPASKADFSHSEFDTHTPYRFSFDFTESGKTFYYMLRWENTRGEKGPWSPILSAVVP